MQKVDIQVFYKVLLQMTEIKYKSVLLLKVGSLKC